MLALPAVVLAVVARPGGAAAYVAQAASGSSTGIGHVAPLRFRVVVVENLTVANLRLLAPRAAVGLLVPGQGASTSRSYALASLTHGVDLNTAVRSSHLGRGLITVVDASTAPTGRTGPNTIVLGLPRSVRLEPNDQRYPIAVIGGGFHGLLTSATTRIRGLVSITDVAPTALGRMRGGLGHVGFVDAVEQLGKLNARIHSNNRIKLPALFIIAGAILLLGLLRPALAVPSLLASLLTSLIAGAANLSSEPLLIAMVVTGTTVGGLIIGRLCSGEKRLLGAIIAVLLAYAVLLAVRPEWIAISPLGPTQNSRFWGIGNQVETLMLMPVVAGAWLAAHRFGVLGFGLFALFVLVLITDNRLGSDGGGAIVFGVALAFVGARTQRLGLRGFATLLGLAAAIVLAVIQINLQSPGANHLRSAFSRGVSGIVAVLGHRIPLAYVPALRQWPMLAVLATAFIVVFALAVRGADGHTRELVLAAALAVGTSLLANDSAIYELTAGLAVIAALAQFKTPTGPLTLAAPPRAQLVRQPVTNEE